MVVRRFGVGVLVLGLLGGACWPVAAWASEGPGKKPVRLRPDAKDLREVVAQQLTSEQWQQMHDEARERRKDGGALMVGGVLLLAGGIGLTAADFADCSPVFGPCPTTAMGTSGGLLMVAGVVAEIVGIAKRVGGGDKMEQLEAVRPGELATGASPAAAPVPSVTATPTAPPLDLRRTSVPPAGAVARDDAWHRLHDDAEQAKRSGRRGVVAGIVMTTLGALLAGTGQSAHSAAQRPCYYQTKSPYPTCPPNSEGNMRTGFGLLTGAAGIVSVMVGSTRASNAERELERLDAMTGVEVPIIASGSRQSVAVVAGREFGLRYRVAW